MQSWIFLALISAVGTATYGLAVKRAVREGDVSLTTASFRLLTGLLLLAVTLGMGPWPALTPAYWRTVALIMPPEILGMIFMSLALRHGEMSLVQPLFGMIPLLVMGIGTLLLGEFPTPGAAVGVLLVTFGVYSLGLKRGMKPLDPIRALAQEPASRYALVSVVAWSVTTSMHKFGIAEVGPLAWATTLTLGSSLCLFALLPWLRGRSGTLEIPRAWGAWLLWVAIAGACFALEVSAFQSAIQMTQVSYVAAMKSISILIGIVLGILLLRERTSMRSRLFGGTLITGGAILIGLLG